MVFAVDSAVSGLNAAQTRLAVSANNVANISSTMTQKDGVLQNAPYAPQRVDTVSLSEGGVRALVRQKAPGTVPVYDPENTAADPETGITQYPNVSPEEEVVSQVTAKSDFKANLKSLKTADEMIGSLLDIFA